VVDEHSLVMKEQAEMSRQMRLRRLMSTYVIDKAWRATGMKAENDGICHAALMSPAAQALLERQVALMPGKDAYAVCARTSVDVRRCWRALCLGIAGR